MQKIFMLLCALVVSAGARAQDAEGSAQWSAKVSRLEGRQYEVVFEAVVTPGWHIYDLGEYPVPGMATSFDFSTSDSLTLIGKPCQSGEPHRYFDEIFGFEIGYFEGTARFTQKVEATEPGATLAGEVEYQVCNDEACIRGTWDFSEKLTEGEAAAPGDYKTDTAVSSATDDSPGMESEGSLWGTILEAIGWALMALITPCVFPMIPMTVSFFLKDNPNPARARFRALMFGVFIVLIYTLPVAVLILTARFAGGEEVTAGIFNWISTHWIPNVLFFLVFMIFSASLLGAFEIRVPSRLLNRSDKNADRAGMIGVFFLALTLVLVSFSCTVPIVGSAVIHSSRGEFWMPITTMLVFSLAFALPFTLFAFFPRLMERLPKSGGWLGSVKVVLGLVEIALGLKFLSVADQTYHWGILDREVYLAVWIVVFAILGFCLLGKIRFKHDSEVTHIGVGRLALAIAVFSFTVWLIPGLWGAPLKAISGYLPPMSTQDFIANHTVCFAATPPQKGNCRPAARQEEIKYADILHLPHGLSGYFDFEQGMEHARRAGKPVFLDFTGHGCVNCREMEERVWVDPAVRRILSEDYVIIALYADDRTKLAEADIATTSSGKKLKTLGRKNTYLMNTGYGINAQPAYLLLDGDGRLLSPVRGRNLDIPAYIAFLESGVEAYNGK